MEKTTKSTYAAVVGATSQRGDLEENRGRLASGHRAVVSGSVSHYLCDFDELSTRIFQSQYTNTPLQEHTCISVTDGGEFIFDERSRDSNKLYNFVRAIMQASERIDLLHAIDGIPLIGVEGLSAEAECMTVGTFDKLWESIQKSPLLKLYNHEKAFYKAFTAKGEFDEALYLSDLNQCLDEDNRFSDASAKQQYWSSLLLQCEGISEERDQLMSSLKEKLAEFFDIHVEVPVAVRMASSSIAAHGEMKGDTEAVEQESKGAYGFAVAPFPSVSTYPEEQQANVEIPQEPYTQKRSDTLEATPYRVNPERSSREQKKTVRLDNPKAAKGGRKKTRAGQQEVEPKPSTKHSKRNSVDIVSALRVMNGQDESAYVCHKGKNDFYVCKSLENEANVRHATNFLEIMNVYELRLEEMFKWLGSSEPVFRWYGRQRIRLGQGDLTQSTVKEVRYYIDKYKSHPLREIQRANIAFFKAVLENPSSVQYCTKEFCRVIKEYFSNKEGHYHRNQGDGLYNLYQDVVDWCRHNQAQMRDAPIEFVITTFNDSLHQLQLPGNVH